MAKRGARKRNVKSRRPDSSLAVDDPPVGPVRCLAGFSGEASAAVRCVEGSEAGGLAVGAASSRTGESRDPVGPVGEIAKFLEPFGGESQSEGLRADAMVLR